MPAPTACRSLRMTTSGEGDAPGTGLDGPEPRERLRQRHRDGRRATAAGRSAARGRSRATPRTRTAEAGGSVSFGIMGPWRSAFKKRVEMMRIPSAAAVLLACAASVLLAQDPAELALTHFAGDQEIATSRLLISRFEVRVKGQSKPSKGKEAVELVALLQLSDRGGIKRYDRELRSARDGSVASAVSIVAGGRHALVPRNGADGRADEERDGSLDRLRRGRFVSRDVHSRS